MVPGYLTPVLICPILTKFSPAYYEHRTWEMPLGHWENIKLNADGKWEAEVVIDGANEDEKEMIRKIENGDVKGASFGLDIIELSEETLYLKQGQSRPTITKWQPYEISLTPSPGNSNASVVLGRKEAGIRLTSFAPVDSIESILPSITHKSTKSLQMKKIALKLGLAEDATEEQIIAATEALKNKANQTETLSKHIEDSAKETLTEEQHAFFLELNKTNSAQALAYLKLNAKTVESTETPTGKKETVSKILADAKVTLSKKTEEEGANTETYETLSKNNPKKLLELKKSDPEKFKELETAYLASRKK
jgi:HK97 family phage prohead protease